MSRQLLGNTSDLWGHERVHCVDVRNGGPNLQFNERRL
jgi:hypothetical protein